MREKKHTEKEDHAMTETETGAIQLHTKSCWDGRPSQVG